MFPLSRLLPLITVAVCASALTVHERRDTVPHGFVSTGAAPGDQNITLRVALKSGDLAGLESTLADISMPGSANFRQWLSADRVKTYVAPSADTLAAFSAFASANGLAPASASPNGEWVSITTTVAHANTLFDADFQIFTHPALAHPLVRTMQYALPDALVGHVATIHPTTSFAKHHKKGKPSKPSKPNPPPQPQFSCDDMVLPSCLQDLYGIPATPATQKNNTLLVTAYGDEFAEQSDVTIFLNKTRPDMDPNTAFTLQTLDGGENPQDPSEAGGEASLDMDYTIGLATDVPITFLSVGGDDFLTALLDTAAFVGNASPPPSVMTTSYGTTESEVSPALAQQLCAGYMALGARGVSVIFSSGDGGVRGNHDDPSECADNTFAPVFPAACPYVTAVGATDFGGPPESAVNFTGGGFSNLFPAPAYQSAAVAQFLSTLPDDFAGDFNKSGRGYPDVAAQGVDFLVAVGGEGFLESGTSASAPTFASVVALLNDRLVAAGRPVLGFLNPFLYANGTAAFNDITTGKNTGVCSPDDTVAFNAVQGWDPLTGLGTPQFANLLTAAGL